MTRWPVTAFLALTPALVFLVLMALGVQDYDRCFLQSGLTLPGALALAAGDLFHPVGFVALLPFLGLASIWHARDHDRLTLALWVGLFAFGVTLLVPASALHDCDRKGTDGLMRLFGLVIPGLLACGIATWASRPRSMTI